MEKQDLVDKLIKKFENDICHHAPDYTVLEETLMLLTENQLLGALGLPE